jgi:hypothetical protein
MPCLFEARRVADTQQVKCLHCHVLLTVIIRFDDAIECGKVFSTLEWAISGIELVL